LFRFLGAHAHLVKTTRTGWHTANNGSFRNIVQAFLGTNNTVNARAIYATVPAVSYANIH